MKAARRVKRRKGGEKIRKLGKVEENRNRVPLLQHKSPEEADHGTSCRTRLLIRQYTHTHTELDPFHPLPSQTVLLMVKTAEGIPMSKTKDRCVCTCMRLSLCTCCCIIQTIRMQAEILSCNS